MSGVPCLLFLRTGNEASETENPLAEPTVQGYALLPPIVKMKHPEILETLSRNHFQEMPKGTDEPPLQKKKLEKSLTLRLFEAEINSKRAAKPLTSPSLCVSIGIDCEKRKVLEYGPIVPNCLKSLSRGIFNFHYSREIHYSEQLDDENLHEIEVLLSQGVYIEYGHHKGGTILHFAIKRRQGALLKLLSQYRAQLPLNLCLESHISSRLLILAVKHEANSVVELILNHKATIDSKVYSHLKKLLEHALANNCLARFKSLLEFEIRVKKCVPYDTIFEFLRMAVGFKAEAFVELLLDYCPVNTFFKHTGGLFQHPFECGPVVFTTVLFGALIYDWYEVVRIFVEGGADVNRVINLCDIQPLGERSNHCNPRNELLRGGCNFLCFIQDNLTPLSIAAACAGEAIIALLLKCGADANSAVGSFKRTPIHYACRFSNVTAVKLLIPHIANIRQYPELLTFAFDTGNVEVVELLLLNRIASSVEDKEFQKCVDVAINNVNIEIMEILFRYGFQLNKCQLVNSLQQDTKTGQNFTKMILDHCFINGDYLLTEVPHQHFFNSYGRIVKCNCHTLVCHVIKRESAELASGQQNISSFYCLSANFKEFRSECKAEVAKLRSEKVGSSDVTFYNILIKNVHQLAQYAKHPDFVKTMKAGDYKSMFPIYASILRCQFEKAAHRQKLLCVVSKLGSCLGERFSNLCDITSQGRFEIIVEKILENLNNIDLEVLRSSFYQLSCKENEM